jgi:proteasome activator subunit 4
VKLLHTIKMRTYGTASVEELWYDEWRNPLSLMHPVEDGKVFLRDLEKPLTLPSTASLVASGYGDCLV